MPLQTNVEHECPNCKGVLPAQVEALGRFLVCSHCGEWFRPVVDEGGVDPTSVTRVLIVSSNSELQEYWRKSLASDTCVVTQVEHPRRALEAATVHNYHVVLIDYSLPEMNGIELAERLRRLCRARLILHAENSVNGVTESQAVKAGISCFVRSPCELLAQLG